MSRKSMYSIVILGAGFLASAFSAHGQVTKIGRDAKVCGLLPIAALEAHFGAKATSIHGSDSATISMCAAELPDLLHTATVTTRPDRIPKTIEQELKAVQQVDGVGGMKISQINNFGSVACYTTSRDIAGEKRRSATCFLENGGHLSLGLESEEPKKLNYEAVKALLEQASARRK